MCRATYGGAAELEKAVQRGAVGIPGRCAVRSALKPLPSNRCGVDLYDDEGLALIPGI